MEIVVLRAVLSDDSHARVVYSVSLVSAFTAGLIVGASFCQRTWVDRTAASEVVEVANVELGSWRTLSVIARSQWREGSSGDGLDARGDENEG